MKQDPLIVVGLLLCGGLVGACNDNVLYVPDRTITESQAQEPAEQVDILLVVDSSCSMLSEQEKLANEFESFTEFFTVAQTDFHIGITTMDMQAQGGALVGSPAVITATTPNAGAVFQESVLVGAEGSGFERGFDAAVAALRPSMQTGANAGFYREEASLNIIFVSDEDDNSVGPVFSYLNHFWDMKGQRDRDRFRVSALAGFHEVTLQPSRCGQDPSDLFAGAREGLRYWEIVDETFGVKGSLCSESFGSLISQMGLAASGLSDRFFLAEEPRPDTLGVWMFIPGTPEFLADGIEVPMEGVDGEFPWIYETNSEQYWIRFTDLDSLPPLGSRLTISYEWL